MSVAGLIRLAIPAGAGLLLACSDYPADPSRDDSPDLARYVGAPGTYDISLERTSEGIVLKGNVAYAGSGLPATGGEVKFYVCKAQGTFAPASVCQSGGGRWTTAFATWVGVSPNGFVAVLFDECPPGATLGFYFKYRSLRTGVADGQSGTIDHTEPL